MTATSSAETGAAYADGPVGPIAYRVTGPEHSDTMVFLHGVNMASGVWDDVIPQLSAYRCITIDLRGHGLSVQRGPFGLDHYLTDIDAVLTALEVRDAQIVGVSLGGLLGCAVARERPERVRSVIAFGSAFIGRHRGVEEGIARLRQMGVANYFAWSLPLGSLPPNVTADVRDRSVAMATVGREDVGMVEEIIRTTFQRDFAHLIPGPVGCPILIVNGELDKTCTPEGGEALAAAAGGRCQVLPGVGHVIPLEEPEVCARLIVEFYQDVVATSGAASSDGAQT